MLLQAILIGLFSLLFIALYRYARIRYVMYQSCPNIPYLSGGVPYFGHIPKLNDLFKFIMESAEETEALGGVAKFWMGHMPHFSITDPDIALTVMNECLQKTANMEMSERWVGQGIFTAKLPRWKKTRKQLNPTFNQQVLDSFMGVFNGQGRRLVNIFEQKAGKGEFQQHHIIAKSFLETSCQTSMGLTENQISVVDDEYVRCMERMFGVVTEHSKSPIPEFMYNLTSLKREEDKLVNYIKSVTKKIFALRKAAIESNRNEEDKTNKKFKTFLELVLEMKDFTDKEILDEVDTMIVAAFHTMQATMMIYLLTLGSYPEIQEKVYEELRELFGDSDRDVTKEDLAKCVYMEATLKESMRVWPIGLVTVRTALEDVNFDTWKIPKGAELYVSTVGLQRSKRVWGPDADEYRPQRWLNPATVPDSPATNAVFGVGKRACIGKVYAMMNLKTVAAHILRRFIVRGDLSRVKFNYEIILMPASGDSISVEDRRRLVNKSKNVSEKTKN